MSTNAFFSAIDNRQTKLKTRLCIGLDPDLERIPASLRNSPEPVFNFNRAIIDATEDLACCFKPQIAHYAAIAAEHELQKTIDYLKGKNIPVILDAKRGDVGSTAERYASELFERYGADAITINPYLGYDSMAPYLDYAEKGVFILCRTSNPGGADIQNLTLDSGLQVYEHIAQLAAGLWNRNDNIALVVGATRPEELARVRQLAGDMTFLLPGIGAQGGDVQASIEAGKGGGLIVSSSRAVIYAPINAHTSDFAAAAREVALKTRNEINYYS